MYRYIDQKVQAEKGGLKTTAAGEDDFFFSNPVVHVLTVELQLPSPNTN